ncbi:MAG: flagellar basal body P-ring protein FlgI [Phycisphaerae bacterium]
MRRARRSALNCSVSLLTLLCLAIATGCEGFDWSFKPKPQEPKAEPEKPKDTVTGDTVGDVALLGDAEGLRLRGFGVVVGLGENGSSDCPTAIRDYLVESLNKEFGSKATERAGPKFSAERLLDSPDSAVVEVQAFVPGAAPKGARIDILVQAIPGTQTRSLLGGVLIPADLRLFDVAVSGEGLLSGAVIARARGPVFVSPFAQGDTGSDPRRGIILGGGFTLDARGARLLLKEPSYPVARQIERRLNERFGQRPKVAEALSRGYVEVRAPLAYADRPERFLHLAAHIFLRTEGGFQDLKLRELAESASKPDAKLDSISLAWEGIGRNAVPSVKPLYAAESQALAFYAARAGLRLKDIDALLVIARIAATPGHEFRLAAVRELADCDMPQAGNHLAGLLDADEREVRIAAYEALCTLHHPRVQSRRFVHPLDPTQPSFVLDAIETRASPFIHVRTSGEARVAVFGSKVGVATPLFYNHPTDVVTISAEDRGDLTIIGQTREKRPLPQPMTTAPRVLDLIIALADVPMLGENKKLRGAGLDYSQVVQVLAALCKDGHIGAPLTPQKSALSDLLTPPALQRPESDEEMRDKAAPDKAAPGKARPAKGASDEPTPKSPGKQAPIEKQQPGGVPAEGPASGRTLH